MIAAAAAIADKSNMVLGKLMLESADFERAQISFDRVRLEGPFSNQALLSAGWADASAENYERALVPWNILVERDVTDSAVQEAMLALPYAYGKLNVHGRAAVLYGRGARLLRRRSWARSMLRSGASRDGKFLKALVREEIKQDKDWVVRLRTLPDAPETYYLTDADGVARFPDGAAELPGPGRSAQEDGGLADQLRCLRRHHPPAPAELRAAAADIDAQFRELDSQIRLRMEQRDHLEQRLQALLIAPRPELLATADERIVLERMRAHRDQLENAQRSGRGGAAAANAAPEGCAHLDAVHAVSASA